MNSRVIKVFKIVVVINICLSFYSQNISAQNPSVKTFIDKSDILIGEPVKYKVTASYPGKDFKVQWFTIPDSVAHFEVVERGKIDSSTNNNTTLLEQTITITSFDSGKWNTPALKINFTPVKKDATLNIYTDSIAINVRYAPADTTNQLRDIKPIMEVKIADYLWYYVGGVILLALILAYVLWRYFKRKKVSGKKIFQSGVSPYDEAMQSFKKLQQLNLQNPDEVKQYHVKMAEIFKWYISRKQQINIMNKTTGDVLVHLSENKMPNESITNAATALRCGDAVKFAKYLPADTESMECLNKLKDIISYIHQKTTNPKS